MIDKFKHVTSYSEAIDLLINNQEKIIEAINDLDRILGVACRRIGKLEKKLGEKSGN